MNQPTGASAALTTDAPTPDYDALISPECGLVRALTPSLRDLDQPDAYVSITAEVSDMRTWAPWPNDPVSLGTTFGDVEGARRAALGEAVERYCGNFIPSGLRRASFDDLRRAGERAVDPLELVLYSRAQHDQPGFPFVPLTRDLEVLWTRGVELGGGEPLWLPASLVYLNYFGGPRRGEPRTNFLNYAGIACGVSFEDACRRALEELVERDALTIWWQSGAPCEGLDFERDTSLRALLEGPRREDFDYVLARVPTRFELPVVGALLRDRRQRLVAFGSACRSSTRQAALKALLEAVHVRVYSLGLLSPDGSIWQAIRAGLLDASVYKPHRPDRRYLDDVRPDLGDVVDLGAHAQIYLDERLHGHVERIWRPPATRLLTDAPDAAPGAATDAVRREGFRPLAVDLTTPDVRACGLYVARVLVPGLYPNAPAAFPYLGGTRLYHEPCERGWLPAPVREEDLLRVPLPHM